MIKIRISPTLINEWASLINGDYETWGKTEQHLKDYILGDFVPNEATSKGNAVNQMIEKGTKPFFVIDTTSLDEDRLSLFDPNLPEDREELDAAYAQCPREYRVYEKTLKKTWRFDEKTAGAIELLHQRMKDGLFEVKETVELQIGSCIVQMNMRMDHLRGLQLNEFKTSKTARPYSYYQHSYQMKAYFLACPDVTQCNYYLIQVPEENKAGKIAWSRIFEYTYLRTGAEEEEIRSMLTGLVEWIKTDQKLLDKLTVG